MKPQILAFSVLIVLCALLSSKSSIAAEECSRCTPEKTLLAEAAGDFHEATQNLKNTLASTRDPDYLGLLRLAKKIDLTAQAIEFMTLNPFFNPDPNALIQAILLASYEDTMTQLRELAEKVKNLNKKKVREYDQSRRVTLAVEDAISSARDFESTMRAICPVCRVP